MPHLTRLRFINIGHENARMNDLILELCDKEGYAIDSTLWLRNGGGKSSILNLFFSLLNPNRQQFLGAKADHGERALEDYILDGDQAVVIAEWQLDATPNDVPVWYLSGSFYERRQDNLERLFFAAYVHKPFLTLDNIPLKDESGRRFNLYGFKQAWQNLGKQHSQVEAQETQNQRDWRHILEQVRLDPELFNYQIRMNSREGGADELFRFKDVDHFVDFFLEMILPSERSDQIAQNLNKFRVLLRQRIEQFQPSLELIEALKPKVQTMLEVASQRRTHREYIGELQLTLKQIQTCLQQRQLTMIQRIKEVEELQNTAGILRQQAYDKAQFYHTRMLSLQRLRLERRVKRLSDEQQELESQLSEAEHSRLMWKATIPLVDVERYEAKVRNLEERLRVQEVELAPDWHEVHAAAHALAAALIARASTTRQSAQTKAEIGKVHRAKAKDAHQSANQARREAGHAEAYAEQMGQQIMRTRASRVEIENLKILEQNEPVQIALIRWQEMVDTLHREESQLVREHETVQKQIDSLGIEIIQSRKQELDAGYTLQNARQSLEEALNMQNQLLEDVVLTRALVEVDTEILNTTSLNLLREKRTEAEIRLRELNANIAENDSVLDYLRANHLLPPTHDVRMVLKILGDQGITAWPGWEHISATYTNRDEARTFITRYPDLVQGVLVRDNHFERAKVMLSKIDIPLNVPIVVAPRTFAFVEDSDERRIFEARTGKRFVIGPTNDAHFDKGVAKDEEQVLELRLQQDCMHREYLEQEILELRNTADHLERFITSYPKEWFVRCKAEIQNAEIYQNDCKKRIVELEQRQHECHSRIKQIRRRRETLAHEIGIAEDHVRRLRLHHQQYGTDAHLLEVEEQRVEVEHQFHNLMSQAEQQDELAIREEEQARQLDDEAKGLEAEASRYERESRTIEYLKDSPSAKAGDVESLRENHRRLCDQINQKTNGNSLQAELEQARSTLNEAYKRFKDELDAQLREDDIRKALLETPDKSAIRTYYNEAHNRAFELSKFVGRADSETKTAQRELEQHQNQYLQLKSTISIEEQNLSEEELERQALLAKTAAEEARTQVTEYTQENESLEREQRQLQLQGQQLESWQKRITTSLADDEFFQDALEVMLTTLQIPPTDTMQFEAYLEELEKELQKARQRRSKLLAERQKIWKSFLDCLGNTSLDLAKALKYWSEEYFEQNVQQLLQDLETREKNTREALEECDSHRATLITEVFSVADRGLKMLSSLANNSKLPDSAGMLAGRPFLKINLTTSESPSEQRQKIGVLIDDIVQEGQLPVGIKLVQRAVRKLSQPIRVWVLFPDIDALPRYIPITEMSKESAGERLTSAVLLYCALAQQRAKERGRNLNVSGSLLLDNPIGAASRTKFLELQRETARSMRIQLIYATGVNDFEAIRTMPNVVRLRNDKQNAKGHKLLEVARVVRPEDNSNIPSGIS